MSRVRITISLFLFVMTTSVFAQATRTWISGVGSDANPCSRIAPCKTWVGAYANTAAGGEIDVTDPGAFGGINITKGIRLDGRGFVSSTLSAAITINTTDKVEIANIQLNGLNVVSAGISVLSAGSVLIDNVDITGYYSDGVYIAVPASTPVEIVNTRIHTLTAGATGIYASATSGTLHLRVTKSTLSDLPGAEGVWATTGAVVTLDHTQVSGCYDGVKADNTSIVNISNSTINQNTGYGVNSNATNALIRVYNSFIQDNTVSGYLVNPPSVIQSTGNSSIQAGTGMVTPQNIGLQ